MRQATYPTQIDHEDYTLNPCGHLGTLTAVGQAGKCLGVFDSDDDALDYIRARMEREQFFPNVWHVSDHGNLSLMEV